MDEKVKTVLAELRAELEKIYGERLKELILFGSQARGDAEAESDIDVAAVLSGEFKVGEEIDRTGELSSELCLKYEKLVSLVFLSEEDYRERNLPTIINIRHEGITV